MSKLASRWATEDTLIQEALEQDSHTKHARAPQGTARGTPASTNAPLALKWAPSPSEPSSLADKKCSRDGQRLPSPPPTREGEKHEERSRRRRHDAKEEPHDNRGSRDSRDKRKHGESKGKEPMGEFAKAFADRLDIDSHDRSSEKPHRNRKSKNEHSEDKHGGPERRRERGHDRGKEKGYEKSDKQERLEGRNGGQGEANDEVGDVLHDKGPMTDAARSLALRIGVPAKEDGLRKQDRHSAKELENGPKKQERYVTPRQKRELAARIDREKKEFKRLEEDRQKQAKLQKEVQEMFDKMSDKSTSWADIEDE